MICRTLGAAIRWRPSSGAAEDRNREFVDTMDAQHRVAAVLRGGRGSQLDLVGVPQGGAAEWRPSSGAAEDRNQASCLLVAATCLVAAVLRGGRGSQLSQHVPRHD